LRVIASEAKQSIRAPAGALQNALNSLRTLRLLLGALGVQLGCRVGNRLPQAIDTVDN